MNTKIDKIFTEISAGELVDKITILEIKKNKISEKEKLNEIQKELLSLNETFKKSIPDEKLIKLQKEKLIFSGNVHQSVEPFGLPKLILLKLSLFYFKQHNIKSLNLVLPNAFGPGDHIDTNRSHALNGLIVRMLDAIKNKAT